MEGNKRLNRSFLNFLPWLLNHEKTWEVQDAVREASSDFQRFTDTVFSEPHSVSKDQLAPKYLYRQVGCKGSVLTRTCCS